MTAPQPARSALPAPLRILACGGPLLWLLSIVDALIRSRGTPDFDGFHWIYYTPALFDFYDYQGRFDFLGTPAFFTHPGYPWYYPAPCLFLLRPLYWFSSHVTVSPAAPRWLAGYLLFAALALAGVGFAAFRVGKALQRRKLPLRTAVLVPTSVTLFSWPLYFALQRGNIEALIFLVFAAAIWAFARQRWLLMALLLGLAASFKLYPAFCFALFLPARRWRELIVGLFTALVVTLLALRTLSPDLPFAWHSTTLAIHRWVADYAVSYSPRSAPYDHSLYELVKLVTLPWHPVYPALLHRYLVATALLATLIFIGRIIRLPRSNQLLFLVLACTSFSPASLDYTLLNLYIPLAWLTLAVVAHPSPARRPALTLLFLLFTLALGPKLFLRHHDIAQQGLATSVCLVALLAIAALVPLPDLDSRPPSPITD